MTIMPTNVTIANKRFQIDVSKQTLRLAEMVEAQVGMILKDFRYLPRYSEEDFQNCTTCAIQSISI